MEEIPPELLSEYQRRYTELHIRYVDTIEKIYAPPVNRSGRFWLRRRERDLEQAIVFSRNRHYADEIRKDLDNFIEDIPNDIRVREPIAGLLYKIIELVEIVG